MSSPVVSALYVYPVKSCRGTSLAAATLDARGIVGDRQFMLVDPRGQFLTQRELPRLALVEPRADSLDDGAALRLTAPGAADFSHTIRGDGDVRDVVVWDDECRAIDQGDEVGRWFSDFLETECRLVRMAGDFVRQVDQRYAPRPTDHVGFSDGFPLLLISEASLAELNSRLAAPVPMDRFRPNIVVAGCEPFAEDRWRSIRIGDVTLAVVKPCARCKITMVDQKTAAASKEKEPLHTLATYRKLSGSGVMFGQNVIHAEAGLLRVGDPVDVSE